MYSPFAQLYSDLADYLKTAVPEIQWIDQDFRQLEHFEYRPEVAFPCVLIDFDNAQFSAEAGLRQMGLLNIVLRIGFAPFAQSYQAAPMDVRAQALQYYEIEQKVFEAVHGWYNDFIQPLVRVSAATEHREDDGLRVRSMVFSTQYEDYSKTEVL